MEKVLLEEELESKNKIFKSIFENSNVGIIFTDKSGKIILSNDYYYNNMLGYTF